MHEVAIVDDLMNTLETHYPDRLDQIVTVEVEAGLLSNVQPVLIQNAYEALILERRELEEIELVVKQLPIIAHCKNCNEDFEVVRHKFVCQCGEASRDIVQGTELRISKVTFITQ